MKMSAAPGKTPSQLIDARIKELGDWRGDMLARLRAVVKAADPAVMETWKWRGVPVWEHDGILCTGETYQRVVKMTFAKGAALPDPAGLFNSSLEGNVRRAIDFSEGDKINEKALQALIRAAVALNATKPAKRKPVAGSKAAKAGASAALKDGDSCVVIAGTHKGKSGKATDFKTSKTGHVTITVVQAGGERFKTLARNVEKK